MMKARVKYTENYNDREGYLVEINTGDGWGLDTFFPLVASARFPMGDANYVHFSLINKIAQLNDLGYRVTFL